MYLLTCITWSTDNILCKRDIFSLTNYNVLRWHYYLKLMILYTAYSKCFTCENHMYRQWINYMSAQFHTCIHFSLLQIHQQSLVFITVSMGLPCLKFYVFEIVPKNIKGDSFHLNICILVPWVVGGGLKRYF